MGFWGKLGNAFKIAVPWAIQMVMLSGLLNHGANYAIFELVLKIWNQITEKKMTNEERVAKIQAILADPLLRDKLHLTEEQANLILSQLLMLLQTFKKEDGDVGITDTTVKDRIKELAI